VENAPLLTLQNSGDDKEEEEEGRGERWGGEDGPGNVSWWCCWWRWQ